MTIPLMSRHQFRRWALDAAERAARSGAAATLGALPLADGPVGIETLLQWEPWSVGLAAAVIDLLISVAARKRGFSSTASLQRTL